MVMQWLGELMAWWGQLPRDMVFFFLIPFMVAAAALLAHGFRCRRR